MADQVRPRGVESKPQPLSQKGMSVGALGDRRVEIQEVPKGSLRSSWDAFCGGIKDIWNRCVHSEDRQRLDGLHEELKFYHEVACDESLSQEARWNAVTCMLTILDSSKALGELPHRDVVRIVGDFGELIRGKSDEDRQALIQEHFINAQGRAEYLAKLIDGVNCHDPALVEVRSFFAQDLIAIAKKDPSYALEHKKEIEGMFRALYPGADHFEGLLYIGELNRVLANHADFSLVQRMECQMRVCLCIEEYQSHGGSVDRLPQDLLDFEKNLPVLNAVKAALNNESTSFEERLDALLALRVYKDQHAYVYGSNAFTSGRSWEDYCAAFSVYAVKEENVNKVALDLLIEVCSSSPDGLNALVEYAVNRCTDTHAKMHIAYALNNSNTKSNADAVFMSIAKDVSLDVDFRIEAMRNMGETQRAAAVIVFTNEIINANLSDGFSKPVLLYQVLSQGGLISKEMDQSLRNILINSAGDCTDKRVQLLLPLMLGQVPDRDVVSAKYLGRILEQVHAVADDPTLSRDEKYILGFLPMKAIVDLRLSPPPAECLSAFLGLGMQVLGDSSELSSAWFYGSSSFIIKKARSSMNYAADVLGLPKDNVCRTVISDLRWHHWHSSLMQKRARPVYHAAPVQSFFHEDGAVINVRWSPVFMEKALPRPRVPDVSFADFQEWVSSFEQEVSGNEEQKALIKTLTDLEFADFIKHANRDEFQTYLDPSRVEGAFVDPTALALRRIIEHAKTLSSEPEAEGELSPKGKLLQQLLVNSTTCQTGLRDAIELTAREIPSAENAVEAIADEPGLTEKEMRLKRDIAALSAHYQQESVRRRQALLNGDSALTHELVGKDPDESLISGVHQSWMMDALLGKRVGVHSAGERFWVDPASFCVYRSLYHTPPQQALDAFYRHYDLAGEIAYFKRIWNEQMESEGPGGALRPQIGSLLQEQAEDAFDWDEEYTPQGLNDYGVALILLKLGVLDEVK